MRAIDCCGIYVIDNRVNGKIYIGSSRNIKSRWSVHLSDLRKGCHHNPILQASWNKHGEHAFELSLLEFCAEEDLLTLEQNWLDRLRPEFNVLEIAGRPIGQKWTAESRAKLSAANVGKVISAETRKKISDSLMGRKLDRDRVERSANARRGKKGNAVSVETRAKIAAKLTGRKNGPPCPTTRAKISAAHLGMKHSDASKLKVSEGRRGKGLGPCSRDKREAIAKAKACFTEDQIRQIRALCNSGMTHRVVAEQFGCSRTCVSYIAKLRSYAWVTVA